MYQQLARTKAKEIVTSDTIDQVYSSTSGKDGFLVYVGTSTSSNNSTVKVLTVSGDEVSFLHAPQGHVLPVFVKRVFQTGTTASNLIGLW